MSICQWSHKSDVCIYQNHECGDETFDIYVRGFTATPDSQSISSLREADMKGDNHIEVMEDWKACDKATTWYQLDSGYPDTEYVTTFTVYTIEDLADVACQMHKNNIRIPSETFCKIITMLCGKELDSVATV